MEVQGAFEAVSQVLDEIESSGYQKVRDCGIDVSRQNYRHVPTTDEIVRVHQALSGALSQTSNLSVELIYPHVKQYIKPDLYQRYRLIQLDEFGKLYLRIKVMFRYSESCK